MRSIELFFSGVINRPCASGGVAGRRLTIIVSLLPLLFFTLFMEKGYCRSLPHPSTSLPFFDGSTVGEVIERLGTDAGERLKPFFDQAGIAYPPTRIALIGLKKEKQLELWAEREGTWVFVKTYEVLAASGIRGPKQKRGDRQVPEGIYQIVSLNPNSSFHLSMKLNYPNGFDIEKARGDRRSNLGGDIYIHGKARSTGCLAVGDRAIEELFVLAATVGVENTRVLILPQDLRTESPVEIFPFNPPWLPELYRSLEREVAPFRIKGALTDN